MHCSASWRSAQDRSRATVDRRRCVEFTWVSEATRGVESVVLFELKPQGDQTEVTLSHSGVPDDEMGRRHEAGWTRVLATLAERFTLTA